MLDSKINKFENSFEIRERCLNLYYIQNKNIKIALCTMGKNENLYAKEFVEYYLKIGVDHILYFME